MANTTLLELKYRTFDQLMNEVYGDLPSLTREGLVEPAQVIKIAHKCNGELGLKINKTKETILSVEHGRAKLPSDFHILNLALLCHSYTVVEPSIYNGLHTENVVTPIPQPVPNLTTCPCWTIVTEGVAQVKVKYCDGTDGGLVFHPNPDGTPSTTKMCLKEIDIQTAGGGPISATTSSFCYNDPNTGDFTCNKPPQQCCTPVQPPDNCGAIDADPWLQNKVFTTCNGTMEVKVIEQCSLEIREYRHFERVRMVPSKEATSFCVNTNFVDARHQGNIKNGYIYLPTLRGHGGHGQAKLYICYLGQMEDEEGNLLVLDHPIINEYYEWALKERILQNAYLNGEPDLKERWQVAERAYLSARHRALSIAATPDFRELKKAIETNRKAMYQKYIHPFSSLWANTPGWPWSLNNEVI